MNRFSLVCLLGLLGCFGMAQGAIAADDCGEAMYCPIKIASGREVNDRLSDKDIPTGQGGFFRDYVVNLKEGDQVAVDLLSADFDTIVMLMAKDGSTVAENDDGSDGSTNSLLFVRIEETGKYTVRVQAFGETGDGNFSLKVTRLQPIQE